MNFGLIVIFLEKCLGHHPKVGRHRLGWDEHKWGRVIFLVWWEENYILQAEGKVFL